MACFSYEIRLVLGGNMRHFLYFMRPRGLKIWKSKTACCIFVGHYGEWSPLCVQDIVCRNGKSTASEDCNATLIRLLRKLKRIFKTFVRHRRTFLNAQPLMIEQTYEINDWNIAMSEVCPRQTKRLRHVFYIRRPTESHALKSRWILIRHIQNYTLRNCCPMFFSWWRRITEKGSQPTDLRQVKADIISQWHNSAIGTAMEVLMPERNQFHTNAWGSGIAKEPLEFFLS